MKSHECNPPPSYVYTGNHTHIQYHTVTATVAHIHLARTGQGEASSSTSLLLSHTPATNDSLNPELHGTASPRDPEIPGCDSLSLSLSWWALRPSPALWENLVLRTLSFSFPLFKISILTIHRPVWQCTRQHSIYYHKRWSPTICLRTISATTRPLGLRSHL